MERRPGLKNRWMSISAAVVFIVLAFSFVGIENGRLTLVDRTGFGEDVELTQTDEVSPNCTITDPNCAVIKRTFTRKFQSGKTLWDLLGILGVPLVLAVLGFWLQQLQQKQADDAARLQQKQADDAAKEEVLQAYFDRLSTLLIDKNVIAIAVKYDKAVNDPSGDKFTDEQKELIDAAKDVIRARTLSILRRLGKDGERKGGVIHFLIETEIVSKLRLDLSNANLSDAYLRGADLRCADLSNANLSDAKLSNANLSDADLRGANLSNANLNNANLNGADLSYAYLRGANLIVAKLGGANLSNADLSDADLRGAKLSSTNLSYAYLRGANLSDAYLSSTNLSYAKLRGADLNGVIILGTNLSTVQGLLKEQLEGENPPYLCKAKLPSNITIDPNRDYQQLPQVLLDRYSEQFKTIEDAQKYRDNFWC